VFIVLAILSYFILGLFLRFEKTIKSQNIIVEGWASRMVIENAPSFFLDEKIDSIFIFDFFKDKTSISLKDVDRSVKLKQRNTAYSLSWNGTLIFEIPTSKLQDTFTLSLTMRGSVSKNRLAHFNIFINKKLIDSNFTTKERSAYNYTIQKNSANDTTYVLINFDNDVVVNNEDRNLYVSNIFINSEDIHSLAIDHFFIPSNSESGMALISELNSLKNYLTDFGLDPLKIKVIKVNQKNNNNTFTLATAAKAYFITSKIKNANVITPDFHSRRSYLNFKNCLKDSLEIGCIPINTNLTKNTLQNNIDERASLLFTMMYWAFYQD
jgi:uncharacterized SAM-binding protein YcdF (DUF218 family)